MELAQFNEQHALDVNLITSECRKALEEIFKRNVAKMANLPGGADNAALLILLQLPASFFHMICTRSNVVDIESAKQEYINVCGYELNRLFDVVAEDKEVRDSQDNFK